MYGHLIINELKKAKTGEMMTLFFPISGWGQCTQESFFAQLKEVLQSKKPPTVLLLKNWLVSDYWGSAIEAIAAAGLTRLALIDPKRPHISSIFQFLAFREYNLLVTCISSPLIPGLDYDFVHYHKDNESFVAHHLPNLADQKYAPALIKAANNLNYGFFFEQQNKWQMARIYYGRALLDRHILVEEKFSFSIFYANSNKVQERSKKLNDHGILLNHQLQVRMRLGHMNFHLRDYLRAIKEYDQVIKLKENAIEAYVKRANANSCMAETCSDPKLKTKYLSLAKTDYHVVIDSMEKTSGLIHALQIEAYLKLIAIYQQEQNYEYATFYLNILSQFSLPSEVAEDVQASYVAIRSASRCSLSLES